MSAQGHRGCVSNRPPGIGSSVRLRRVLPVRLGSVVLHRDDIRIDVNGTTRLAGHVPLLTQASSSR